MVKKILLSLIGVLVFAAGAFAQAKQVRGSVVDENGAAVIGVKMPCVVTFTKPAWDPRYPTIKRKMAANKAEIPTLTAADLPSIDLEHAGLKGSPTKVKKTFVPQKKSGGVKIKEETNEDSAKKLCQLLSEAGII